MKSRVDKSFQSIKNNQKLELYEKQYLRLHIQKVNKPDGKQHQSTGMYYIYSVYVYAGTDHDDLHKEYPSIYIGSLARLCWTH